MTPNLPQQILETLPLMVLSAKADGAVDFLNPACTSYAGLPQTALFGSGWLDVVHPDDRHFTSRDWAESIRSGRDYRVEHRLRRADGEYRWFACHVRPVCDASGVVERWTGTWSDVTEKLEQAEREAQRTIEQLRVATRLSGVQVWSFELPKGGPAVSTCLNVWESLGYEPGKGPLLAENIHPADLQRIVGVVQSCLDGEADQFEFEYRLRHEDDSIRWNLARGVVMRDSGGGTVRFTGTSVDVTRLKEVEEDARAATERLELAAQLSSFAVTDIDLRGSTDPQQGTVTGAYNWDFKKLRTPVMPSQADYVEAIHPDDRASMLEAFRASVSGTLPEMQVEYRSKNAYDDGYHWRLGRGKCFYDESGAPARYIGTSHDIQLTKTAQEEARWAAQQLRLATELSGVGVWGYRLSDDGDLANAESIFDNDGVMSSLGYGPTEVASNLAARLGAVVHPDDQPRLHQLVQDCLTGKAPQFDAECRFLAKDGSLQWRLVRGLVTRDDTGRPLTFMGTAVDINGLKFAEQQVKAAEEEARRTQWELHRVKERLELAVLYSKTCTWDFELADGQVAGSQPVFVNAWELCGYEAPDDPKLAAQAFGAVFEPDEIAPTLSEIQSLLDGPGREWEREVRIAHKDGSRRFHLTRGVVTRNASGQATRFTGASIDITDRKLTEKMLRESEERFRGIFENAAVGMILTDLEGRFLEYNTRFCEFLGYTREELAGRRFVDFMVRDEIDSDMEHQQRVVLGEIPSFTRDKRYFRKDGSIVWGNITVSVIQRNPDGTPAHVMGILQDITERKALEVEVQKQQRRMELALRGSDVSVFDGIIPSGDVARSTWSYFNMWERRGIDPATTPSDFQSVVALTVHPDDLPTALEKFREMVQMRARDFYLEHRVLLPDGLVSWRLTRGTFLYDDAGRVCEFLGTETDITRLKAIEGELQRARETAEAANRAKDEFLANVSHEIRTPMNAILGMTELAIDSSPTDHQRQLLSTVRSAAKNLLSIINDLLDFSKIEAGKLTLDHADFSLRAAIGDTLRALAVRAHRKGLELLCHVQPDVPDALDGDAGRLRQVLMNLVGNAIKFTQRGEVEVEIRVAPGADSQTVPLIFIVRDTGIGIAPEKHAAIFRAFEQEDASTTRKYGGTGLGLTISSQFAALMGGDITVVSAPGRGSTFRFTARFARSSRPETAVVSPERLADLRVLVVDDNETNRRILVEWLTSWRMRPTAAGDSAAALGALSSAQAEGTPFSLVLLDARMPDTDGVTLAAEIHRRWDAAAPRLILLSSDDNPTLATRSRENGVLAYLLKPVQQSELLEAIWAAMNLDLSPPAPAAGARPDHSPALRVLVAEDNELNVALLQQLFSLRGHRAQFARDGRAALGLAVQGPFDLMLLDLHMPELDGFEVVRAIREQELGTRRHLPIIALTARSSARDRERCLDAGMDEFLSKPIDAAVLWQAVDRLMKRWPPAELGPRAVEPGLLDARAILRACGGQGPILERLCVVFRQILPLQMSAVRAAQAAGDLAALREAAHQLVGTVGAFSTVTADVAKTLEDAAVRQEAESCAALVGRLASMCDALLETTVTLTLDTLSL